MKLSAETFLAKQVALCPAAEAPSCTDLHAQLLFLLLALPGMRWQDGYCVDVRKLAGSVPGTHPHHCTFATIRCNMQPDVLGEIGKLDLLIYLGSWIGLQTLGM